MQFKVTENIHKEIFHFYDSDTGEYIASNGNQIDISLRNVSIEIKIPISRWESILMNSRLTRRLFRLDKMNVVLNKNNSGVVIIYQSVLYFFSFEERKLIVTGRLLHARNVLHSSIAVTHKGIYLGEYWGNPNRDKVPIWVSKDDGKSWEIAYQFPRGSIRHVHGIFDDEFSENLYITSGDLDGECYLIKCNQEFNEIKYYGDGSQEWRSVNVFFSRSSIFWGMDSPLSTNYIKEFNRHTSSLTTHRKLPGPAWYGKSLSDGTYLIQTTSELGPGSPSNYSHVFASCNLKDWIEVSRFKKDYWPKRFFKFGIINFAEGPQSITDFVMSGEALKNFDGITKKGCLFE
tara:strand:+ start:311 stop:1348 length:1038 start_codon:yes stop_codon:yes gene_type:complete